MYIFAPNIPIKSAELNANFAELRDGTGLDEGSIEASKLISDAVGHGQLEIARTTLTVAGDTITVSDIPARRYLKFIFVGIATGGTLDTNFIFNNDTGANYASKQSVQLTAAADLVSATAVSVESGATDSGQLNWSLLEVINVATNEKSFRFESASQDAAGGATPPVTVTRLGKWANTSAQINRIDWINAGTGDFAIGSEIIVLGNN